MDPRIRIPRIRIHTKMSCILNTGDFCEILAIPTVLQVVAALLSLSKRKFWSTQFKGPQLFKLQINSFNV
jgi:hypothetical protein